MAQFDPSHALKAKQPRRRPGLFVFVWFGSAA
jgi:hypothetical protein